MSVQIIANNDACFDLDVSNRTWFTLLDGPLNKLLPSQHTNDEIEASSLVAKACAEAMKDWLAPDDWFLLTLDGGNGKGFFVEFFNNCGGFTAS